MIHIVRSSLRKSTVFAGPFWLKYPWCHRHFVGGIQPLRCQEVKCYGVTGPGDANRSVTNARTSILESGLGLCVGEITIFVEVCWGNVAKPSERNLIDALYILYHIISTILGKFWIYQN
jgi:hypothetical protein